MTAEEDGYFHFPWDQPGVCLWSENNLWIAPALLLDQCCGLHGKDFVPGLLSSPPLVNGLVGAHGDIDGCIFN